MKVAVSLGESHLSVTRTYNAGDHKQNRSIGSKKTYGGFIDDRAAV